MARKKRKSKFCPIKDAGFLYIDTHVHSKYSDGRLTPDRLFKKAKERKLDGIVLSDHDTVTAWAESLTAARRHGMATVLGVEITSLQGHVLGYFPQDADPKLISKELGLDYYDASSKMTKARGSRARFGRKSSGKKSERPLVFDCMTVVKKIHELGGVAVAPHPFSVIFSLRKKADYSQFDGIETYNFNISRKHNNEASVVVREKQSTLGGSDCHTKYTIGAGLTVFPKPDWLREKGKKRLSSPKMADWLIECMRGGTASSYNNSFRREKINNLVRSMPLRIGPWFRSSRRVYRRYLRPKRVVGEELVPQARLASIRTKRQNRIILMLRRVSVRRKR